MLGNHQTLKKQHHHHWNADAVWQVLCIIYWFTVMLSLLSATKSFQDDVDKALLILHQESFYYFVSSVHCTFQLNPYFRQDVLNHFKATLDTTWYETIWNGTHLIMRWTFIQSHSLEARVPFTSAYIIPQNYDAVLGRLQQHFYSLRQV